jgi:hypothetical protein
MKPTVGRIVHYFNMAAAAGPQNNQMGPGPYAALVVQVFSEHCVSLKVFAPTEGNDRIESSVESRGSTLGGRFWDWPKIESEGR